MPLIELLTQSEKKDDEMITFYHVSTEVESFKSFFREGAKSIGRGVGGQTDGFYVLASKEAAERHIRFLENNINAEKNLKNKEAMIIGVTIPKSSISYPLWQEDYEASAAGIFRLWTKYGDFLNNNASNLNIPFDLKEKPFGWEKLQKITSFSFKKGLLAGQKDCYEIYFNGLSEQGKEVVKLLITDNLDNEGLENTAEDSVKYQILTDWLCQNNSDFKKEYDELTHKKISNGKGAFKYTGSEPLPITFAQYVKVNEDGSLKKKTIFDAKKGGKQVCPFLALALASKSK